MRYLVVRAFRTLVHEREYRLPSALQRLTGQAGLQRAVMPCGS